MEEVSTLTPEQIAEILNDYIKKYGLPPSPTESIEVYIDGRAVVINLFSMEETA